MSTSSPEPASPARARWLANDVPPPGTTTLSGAAPTWAATASTSGAYP